MIEGLGRNARNPRAALEEIYLTVLDIIGETFEAQGARGGFPRWARLQLSTVVDKATRGADPRILFDSSELFESMTTYRHPLQQVRIDNSGITLAPRLARGRIHQKGAKGLGTRGQAELPARPFIRFTESDRQAFAREILRHLVKHTRASVGGVRIR